MQQEAVAVKRRDLPDLVVGPRKWFETARSVGAHDQSRSSNTRRTMRQQKTSARRHCDAVVGDQKMAGSRIDKRRKRNTRKKCVWHYNDGVDIVQLNGARRD